MMGITDVPSGSRGARLTKSLGVLEHYTFSYNVSWYTLENVELSRKHMYIASSEIIQPVVFAVPTLQMKPLV
jgi:hypothetical protein